MIKKTLKLVICVITFSFVTACSNNYENILLNNNYKKKEYDSGFITYSKSPFLISVFKEDKKSTFAYEDSDELSITTTSDDLNVYSTSNCNYNFSTKKAEGNCNDNIISEIKQAKREINKELKKMNLTFSNFTK